MYRKVTFANGQAVAAGTLISALQKKYGTSAGLEKELTRFEKRGTRARNRFEKQVRTQRTKFEREMRQRRKAFEKQSTAVQARVEEIVSAAQGLIS